MPNFDSNAFVISGNVASPSVADTVVFLAPCDVYLQSSQFSLGTANSAAVNLNVKVNPPTSPAVYQLSTYVNNNGVTVNNTPTQDTSRPTTAVHTGDYVWPAYTGAADFTPTGTKTALYSSDIVIAATKKAAQGGAADGLGSQDGRVNNKIFAGSLVYVSVVSLNSGTGAANLYYGLEFTKA